MELYQLLPFITLPFLFIVASFFLKKRKTSSNPTTAKLPIPRGSLGWPVSGETSMYFSMANKGISDRFIADRIVKYSSPKIFKTSLLGETMAVMCTPEGNKFLFGNENKLVESWWPFSFQRIFIPSEGPNTFKESSKQLRKLVLPSFQKPQSLQHYAPNVDSLTKRHMRQCWQGKQAVMVHELTRKHTFELACRLFLSIEDGELIEKLEKLIVNVGTGMISVPINLPGTRYRRGLRASKLVHKEILDIIKTRKESRNTSLVGEHQDLLSHMMSYTDENGEFLNERDIGDKFLSVLIASHENTSITMSAVVKYLAELPHVYNQVWEEQTKIASSKVEGELLKWDDIQKMTYSWNVAREALRLVPPSFGSFREAITEFNYQGFFIPKGWKLHWNVHATHTNPTYFPDPKKFDPTRFEGNGPAPYSYVPFGGGARMCPGYEFARLEVLTFMHNLVTKYKFEKVFPDEEIIGAPNPAPTRGLPIRLYPY